MRVVMFYHSLLSDWNHGNAHFLRGVATELLARGHQVAVYEPADAWSLRNLLNEHGEEPVRKFRQAYPTLSSTRYKLESLDLDRALDGADLVLVHEWNDHELIRRIGHHRASNGTYRLFFHDTHHRSVTDAASMAAYDLRHYDGVLAFGQVIRDLYLSQGWARRAWTWHEAADTRVFKPLRISDCRLSLEENDGAAKRQDGLASKGSAIRNPASAVGGDLVWIGNWGDEERTAELREFLIEPVNHLRLKARLYGVRYPEHARLSLNEAGIEYGGWLPNYEAPRVFSQFKVTVHVPRRPYVTSLPGIPTIRVFEALACGIPLVCSPWDDAEGLFTAGKDYLAAPDGRHMKRVLRELLADAGLRQELAAHGRQTILSRHTCAHRVDELLGIYAGFEKAMAEPPAFAGNRPTAQSQNGQSSTVRTNRPTALCCVSPYF